MASLLLPDEQTQPLQPLLPLDDPDKLPPALQPDPRAEALGQLYRQLAARTEKNTWHGIWDPNNPVNTETLQSAGMPKPTTYAGPVGQFIDPATGKLTDQGKARLDDNPALGFDTGGLSGGGLLGGLKAYHGSPHKFDQFSDHAIGTGEGAQAYGYGHYVAENEGVARGYRDALAPQPSIAENMTINGKTLAEQLPPDTGLVVRRLIAGGIAKHGGDVGAALDDWVARSGQLSNMAAKAAEHLRGAEVILPKPAGHMYEVNVAADPEKFLHWDKPLNEQSQFVRDALSNLPGNVRDNLVGVLRGALDNPGGPASKRLATGEQIYKDLSDAHSRMSGDPTLYETPRGKIVAASARGASDALAEAGIKGIRYLDAGSRSAGEGSHNLVVFSPETMEIIRRYGIAGLLGGAAATGAAGGSRKEDQ